MTNDLDDAIDELARRIERKIDEGEKKLEELPEFSPRSERGKKLRKLKNQHDR
jgi:hypothetical protein